MTTRTDFIALFSAPSDAVDFENEALSAGSEFLPPCAVAVLADSDAASPEYWAWLVGQVEAADVHGDFGDIIDYRSNDVIREATRADWLYAKEHGQPHTGVYTDLETGRTVWCDGRRWSALERASPMWR